MDSFGREARKVDAELYSDLKALPRRFFVDRFDDVGGVMRTETCI